MKATLEKAVALYNEAYGSYDEETKSEMVNEEIVARFIETTLSEPKRLLDEIDGNTSLIGRIKDILKSFVSQQGQLTQNDKTLVNKAYNAFKSAIETKKTDKRNYTMSANAKGATQWSIKKTYKEQLEDYLQYGKDKDYLFVGQATEQIATIGGNDSVVLVAPSVIDKVIERHGLPLEIVEKLDDMINNPLMIFKSQTEKDSLVLFSEEVVDNENVIVALNVKAKEGFREINKVASFYTKQKTTNFVKQNIQNELMWIEKQKGLQWLHSRGLQLPKENTINDLGYIIRKTSAKVNTQNENILESNKNDKTQYSLSDSQGRTLTQEQAEFFKDSKVRDNEGNLLVVYHGTDKEFFTFEMSKNSKRNVWGEGFYFAKGKGLAYDYGKNIIEAFLDIKNPYINGESNLGTAEYIKDKYFNEMWENSRQLGIDYITNKLEHSPIDLLQFIAEKNNKQVADILKEYGYDGIIDGSEMVAFDSNQIKLIENKAPTKKDDIRYSLSDIDKFSERQYNDYAWAQVNDVLSRGEAKTATQEGTYGEIEQFNKKFSELTRQKGQFPQTANGEHMLSVENKIVYVAGTFQSPRISQIVEIDAKDGDELAVAMTKIYQFEKQGVKYERWLQTIKDVGGEANIIRHRRKDWSSYQELKESRQNENGATNSYWNGKPRGYNFEESDGSGASGTIKGKTQFSVADTYSAKKAYTRNEMKAVVDNITAFGVFGDELAKIAKGKTVDKIYELMNSAPIGKEAEYAENRRPQSCSGCAEIAQVVGNTIK